MDFKKEEDYFKKEINYFRENINKKNEVRTINDLIDEQLKEFKKKSFIKIIDLEDQLTVKDKIIQEKEDLNKKYLIGILENLNQMLIFYKDDKKTVEKIKRIKNSFKEQFEEVKIEEIIAKEKDKFDNNLHEPVEAIEKSGFNQYEIVEVLEYGYKQDGKVKKEVKVIVAK